MNKRHQRWWPRITVALLAIYWMALLAGTHTPNFSTGTAHYNDKAAHFCGYLGLAFLLGWAWSVRQPFPPRGPILAALVAIVYGALDELTQMLVPGRAAEVGDWIADSLGAMTGIGLFWILYVVVKRQSTSTTAKLESKPPETDPDPQ